MENAVSKNTFQTKQLEHKCIRSKMFSLTLPCVIISYSKDNNYKPLVVALKMGPHVGNLTKLFPWLVMGMTAVKHKEAADSPAFQASPNPTLSPAQKPNVCTHHAHGLPPKYTHRSLQFPLQG